jgi:hypothetical protein
MTYSAASARQKVAYCATTTRIATTICARKNFWLKFSFWR